MNKRAPQYDRLLSVGWMIQASSKVKQTGNEISKPDFDTRGWYSASIPSTVLAVLVENGVYENPYFGMNLEKISNIAWGINSLRSHQVCGRYRGRTVE